MMKIVSWIDGGADIEKPAYNDKLSSVDSMSRKRPTKYGRVSVQQKEHLKRLTIRRQITLKEAANSIGINYSTAKTIMFLGRKKGQCLPSLFPPSCVSSCPAFAQVREQAPTKTIQIISSIGNIQRRTINTTTEKRKQQTQSLKLE